MANSDERPAGARVTLAMLGSTGPPMETAWTEKDTILYALGVGAGATDADLRFTTENSAGINLQVLPTFLTALTQRCKPLAFSKLDEGRFLHASQQVELFRDIPVEGRVFMCPRIDMIADRGSGKGAVLRNAVSVHAGSVKGPIIGRTYSRVYVTGGGGFGGVPDSNPPSSPPQRAPDFVMTQSVRIDQSLLYRLSGDRNPLHSDPSFARPRGFTRPILHGLCTYGFACRALIEALGNPELKLVHMSGRFRRPVYPGSTLSTQIWRDGVGSVRFQMHDQTGEVVLQGGHGRFKKNYAASAHLEPGQAD